jgi:GABA(A) receptor-associated protein
MQPNNVGSQRFREEYPFATRLEVSTKIRAEYPNQYPVVVELDPQAQRILEISKKKFLAPHDISLANFMLGVRKCKVINIPRQDPLAVMVERGEMVSGDATIADLYNRFRDPDGFLYILFSGDM